MKPSTKKSTSPKRQLAVILFADIVGYTGIMQKNEQQGLQMIRRFRKALHDSVARYDGKIYQEYGDGCLCLFSSSIHAINCALEIQKSLAKTPNVPLRIGIHLGDIVYLDGCIYGNSINIASRIESLGIAGSILISSRLIPDLKNHPELNCVSLGFFHFKNIEKQMEVFALSQKGLIIPERKNMRGKLKLPIPATAILRELKESALNAITHFFMSKTVA